MRLKAAPSAILVALAATIVMAAPAGAVDGKPEPASEACPAASDPVADSTAADLRKSVRCLIGAERAARGLPKLRGADTLDLAAKRHVRTMIDTDCLAHKCPGEADLERRLRRAGYIDGVADVTFAESTGCGTTAFSMFTSWLTSTFDRANILDADYEDIGVAALPSASEPLCGDGYGTFAVVLGTREP
jgi:uncharacterized protein YkwD